MSDKTTFRQQWRAMSESSELQLDDPEFRVKLDAAATIQERERKRVRRLTKQWKRRVPINQYDERFRQLPPR